MQEELQTTAISELRIDGVEVLELIGKGGMAVVYKAKQLGLDRIVALKVFNATFASESQLQRFRNEAKVTGEFDHPNIVKTLAYGLTDDGRPYMLMEYIQGKTLAVELAENGRLSFQRFRDLFLPLLAALDYAHNKGLVHRDIKPGNIMICRQGESKIELVKLLDFGIAKFLHADSTPQNLTATGAIIGSPNYMSPEQCMGKPVDHRSDLYSLSCVMHEALLGEPPFVADTAMEVMGKHLRQALPTVAELNGRIELKAELAPLLLSGLAKDPQERPGSAREMRERLSRALENTTLSKVPRLKEDSAGMVMARTFLFCGLFVVIAALGFMGLRNYLEGQKTQTQISKQSVALNLDTQIHRARALQNEGKLEEAIRIYEDVIPKLVGNKQKRVSLYSAYYQSAETYIKLDTREGKIVDPLTRNAELYSLRAQELAVELKDRALYQTASELRNSAYTHLNNRPEKVLEVVSSADRFLVKGSWESIDVRQDACVKLLETGNLKLAEELALDTADLAEKTFGTDAVMALRQKGELGYVYAKQGRKQEADELLERVAVKLVEGADPGILPHRRATFFVDIIFPALASNKSPSLIDKLSALELATNPEDVYQCRDFKTKVEIEAGNAYKNENKLQQALARYEKAWEMEKAMQNIHPALLNPLLEVCNALGLPDKARNYKWEAVRINNGAKGAH